MIMQVGFKGFQIDPSQQKVTIPFSYEGKEYKLSHGKSQGLYYTTFYALAGAISLHFVSIKDRCGW